MLEATVKYPETRKCDHIETYFGKKIPDPYRWLEDDNATETLQWVDEQNALTNSFLESIPFRAKIRARLETIYNYPKYSPPCEKAGYFFFTRNNGLQNQFVHYVQKGLEGNPEVLLDPNVMSADGTVQIREWEVSKDAGFMAYSIVESGSDWQEIRIMDIRTRAILPERLKWVKFSTIAWCGDGFYYSRYDSPPTSGIALSEKNENHRVFYHTLHTDQGADELIFEDQAHPQRFHMPGITEDERFLLLYILDSSIGKKGNALLIRDLSNNEVVFRPLISEFDDFFWVIDSNGDKLTIHTSRNAPNGRVICVNTNNIDEQSWQEIIPERPEPVESINAAGGKLFLAYLKDVTHRITVYDAAGHFENDIALPALGTAEGFVGEKSSTVVFYTFESFTSPPMNYKYDIASCASKLFQSSSIDFKPDDFCIEQVFYASADGTKIPMFIICKKGVQRNGQNPTLLYGYGGFGSILNPKFDPLKVAWMEQGGIYAVANLRGGGEYGERWHEAGMKLEKENVFADFIAAAEWLFSSNYTCPDKLVINGRSNGGLLIGAVMTKRPDLCKVAIPSVGVMDMLRFQKFTIGWAWQTEYGSSDDATYFPYLLGYSPLHNLKAGVQYPATLVTTADHDDRVVPAHSFKFIATLQDKQVGDNPTFIRIEKKSGHGASNTSKRIDETADVYTFIFKNLGLEPTY